MERRVGGRAAPVADYLEAYLDLRAVPYRQGSLEPKVKAFVCLAADAATTHLYQPGIHTT